MKNILVIGAGRSSTDLIEYLLDKSKQYQWKINVADQSLDLANQKINGHPDAQSIRINITDEVERRKIISENDLIVSMLPASLHYLVGQDCLDLGKHLLTASYVSDKMYDLVLKARKKGLIFMGELGLDPGLDHMSALMKIHEIRENGGLLQAFYSYTGGLVAPESDDNPWHYKFTWNPRNVVLAGNSTASYVQDGNIKYMPYQRLFRSRKIIDITNFGQLEMYPNRNSIKYKPIYGLENIPTLIRGTLRYLGFCDGWDAIVKIGLTDDSVMINNADTLTYREWLFSFVGGKVEELEESVSNLLHLRPDSEVLKQLHWLGLFSDKIISLKVGTSAKILEELLLGKWKMEETDLDMIVMQHEFIYSLKGALHKEKLTLVHKGKNSSHTAMSQLVGLPLAIFAKEIMIGKIKQVGVARPVTPDVYIPILSELSEMGISFVEKAEIIDKKEARSI